MMCFHKRALSLSRVYLHNLLGENLLREIIHCKVNDNIFDDCNLEANERDAF